jgi:hypothetical protein
MRLINNAIPNMARDDPNDVDLSPKQADDLFRYQLTLSYPRYLSEKSCFVAGIVGAESLSKRVYKALVKHKILPAPENQAPGQVSMTVNTAGVTKNFASQLAIISVHAQRKLVGMLFFWEEECMRWKLLDEEEREILSVLDSLETGENRDLALALEAVGMKKRMLPSQRAEGAANVGRGTGHELPSYA